MEPNKSNIFSENHLRDSSNFYCEYCCLALHDDVSIETHLAGKRHRRQKDIVEKRKSEISRSIYVGSLTDNMKPFLHNYFEKFGAVENVILMRGSAIVIFTEESSASKALSSRHHIEGNRLMVRERRFENPLPMRNKEEYKLAVASEESRNKYLREKIRNYQSIEHQMIILQTELTLTKPSINAREEIRNVCFSVLSHYFPNSELHLFGSSANGFGFEGCDVDLHLKLPVSWSNLEDERLIEEVPTINDIETSNVELLSNSAKLKLIRKIIKRYVNNIDRVSFIPSLRCPLLRFKYKHYTGELICDLSIGKGISVRNTKLLMIYRQLDSRVLLLITTLRWWAKHHQLINSDCKLTSYAFILMAIFFLQNLNPPVVPTVQELAYLAETKCIIDSWDCSFCENLSKIPKSTNKQPIEELLKDFFKFYTKFDFTTIISPRLGRGIHQNALTSDCSLKEFKIGPICIQDPFILNRNIASNFKSKYLPDFIGKLSFCAELLSKGSHHAQGNDCGVAALLREIPTESDSTEPLLFVISKDNMPKSDALLTAGSSELQITNWFKIVCSVVKCVLAKALCCKCDIMLDSLKENELQLTRKRSHSFSSDNEQQNKHFMGDLVFEDRITADNTIVSSSAISAVEGPKQSTVPHVKTSDSEIVNVTNENFTTRSNEEYSIDVEMQNLDNSEVQSRTSLQQQDYSDTYNMPCNKILLHMQCKVQDNIWHQRRKMSKKYKLDKRDSLDIEHEISQEIIKLHGNNKYFIFDCRLLKHLIGGIPSVKCEFKAVSKNSHEKLKQFIVPFVSKLVNKHMMKSR